MKEKLKIIIPEGLDFEALKLSRDTQTGDIEFEWSPIEKICEASGLEFELFQRSEDNVSGLIMAWYAEHVARGGAPDPVQEDLIAETLAENEHGGGISHPPGRA